ASYTVSEDASGQPAGYDLTDVSCTGGETGTAGSVASHNATVNIAAGETVICTFTNTKHATVLIRKHNVGGNTSDTFHYTTSSDLNAASSDSSATPALTGAHTPKDQFDLQDYAANSNQQQAFDVKPNSGAQSVTASYTVSEDASGQPAGYDLTDVSCTGGETGTAGSVASHN